MPLIAAKCVNCGGEIQLDDTKDSGDCLYCGSKVLVQELDNQQHVEGLVCHECGLANMSEGQYCEKCGVRIRASCRYCRRVISIQSKLCPYCGNIHHQKQDEDFDEGDLDEAMELSLRQRYSDAENIYRKIETHYVDSDIYYCARINNFINWAVSLSWNSGTFQFAHLYKSKAKDLMDVAREKFPTSEELVKTENLWYESYEKKMPVKSSCFVATAVYGDPLCPEVCALRSWRDEVLSASWGGRVIIRLYYLYGPGLAGKAQKSELLQQIFKRLFNMFISAFLKNKM